MIVIIPLVVVTCTLAWVLRPGKSPSRLRKIAILTTAIPPLVLAVVAVIFQLWHNAAGRTWVSDISNTCFIISLGMIGLAIFVTIGFVIARKWELARGMGFGICISVLISIIELAVLEWLAGV